MPVLTYDTYDDLNTYSINNPKTLIVINFKAKWCMPCKTIYPFLKYLQENYPNIDFMEIDIEDDNTITEHFTISKVPTFIYYKNGNISETVIGTNKEKIENAINDYL